MRSLFLSLLLPLVAVTGFITHPLNQQQQQQQHQQRVLTGSPCCLFPKTTTTTTTAATGGETKTEPRRVENVQMWWNQHSRIVQETGLALLLTASVLMAAPSVSWAAKTATASSGFAHQDISGRDFSSGEYVQIDFTGVVAQNTNFRNADLRNSIFRQANLVNADFTGADLRGANFVDAKLDKSRFKEVNAGRATFSATILDIGDLEGIDLTDSIWPSKLQVMICDMDELKGTNTKTGVDSRESILCE